MFLLSDELNSIFILHPTLNQSQSNQHRSPVCMHKQTQSHVYVWWLWCLSQSNDCILKKFQKDLEIEWSGYSLYLPLLDSVQTHKLCKVFFCFSLVCPSPPQSSHTVNSHAAPWILLKLLLQQTQPIIDQFTGGRGSIVKRPILKEKHISYRSSGTLYFECKCCVCVWVGVCLVCAHHHINAVFLQRCFIIRDITDSNNCGGTVVLQVLKGTTVVGDLTKLKCLLVVSVHMSSAREIILFVHEVCVHVQCVCQHTHTHTFLTSMKELSVLSVGLCVMRNLMFLWHSSTGAGRFMVASVNSDLYCICEQLVSHKPSVREKCAV